MKGYRAEAARGCQHVAQHRQGTLKFPQFIVNLDAEGLKAAGSRMNPLAAPRHRAGDHGRQLGGRAEGLAHPHIAQATRNAPGVALFPVVAQAALDLVLFGVRQPVGNRFAAVRVHAHVERAVVLETESPLCLIELRGRHPEIKQDAVEPGLQPLGA